MKRRHHFQSKTGFFLERDQKDYQWSEIIGTQHSTVYPPTNSSTYALTRLRIVRLLGVRV